jgi:hypothetical protein
VRLARRRSSGNATAPAGRLQVQANGVAETAKDRQWQDVARLAGRRSRRRPGGPQKRTSRCKQVGTFRDGVGRGHRAFFGSSPANRSALSRASRPAIEMTLDGWLIESVVITLSAPDVSSSVGRLAITSGRVLRAFARALECDHASNHRRK